MDKPIPNYDQVIFQIDNMFNVKDIMTRTRDVKYAQDIDHARQLSEKCKYDIVPIGDANNLHSYYDRVIDSVKDIKKEDLLAGDTGISALVSYLEKRQFYFILEYNHIVGLVNMYDLNKLLSSIPVYVTSVYAEYAMRTYFRNMEANHQNYEEFLSLNFAKISEVIDNNGLNNNFNFQNLEDRFNEARKNGFYTDIYDEFEFWQELALYYFLKERLSSQADWDKVKNYKEIRNRTMHMKDHLPYSNPEENLSQLLAFLHECTKIIKEVSSKNFNRNSTDPFNL